MTASSSWSTFLLSTHTSQVKARMDLRGLGRFGKYWQYEFKGFSTDLFFVEVDFNAPHLFRRCANCPPESPPCPTCASDEVCSLIAGGCDSCAMTMCTKIGAQPTSAPTSSGPAAGPIAGGVIGGVAAVCLMTFLVWRFCIKKRRERFEENDWQEEEDSTEKSRDEFGVQRDARASVQSVRSIASTVLTRASNVIQIAYIPGVTNRSVDSTPDLIPPVPPIPAFSPAGTPQPQQQDQHFFMPSDLRDSTYSDYTVDRTSYARSSIAPSMPRGSFQSTAYRGSAVVNAIPAQTAIRGKANPVAVRSNGKNSPAESRSATPPLPILDRQRHDLIKTNTTSPIVARLGIPKAVNVTKPQHHVPVAGRPSPVPSDRSNKSPAKLERHASVASSRHNPESSTFDDASSSDEDSPADQSLMGHDKLPQFAKAASISSNPMDPPVRSPSSAPDLRHSPAMVSSSSSPDSHVHQFLTKEQKKKHKRSGSLNQIIEEATRRASREPRHGGLGSMGNVMTAWTGRDAKGEGPFSDAHAARTP